MEPLVRLLVLGTAGAAAWWFLKSPPARAALRTAAPDPWTIPRPGKGPVATTGRPEALKWLNDNPNAYAFGVNMFQKTENAAKYVKDLYKLGAVKVIVADIRTSPGMPGAESDTLFVKMPINKEQRFALANFILNGPNSPDEFHLNLPKSGGGRRIRETPNRRDETGINDLKGGAIVRLWWD